MTRLELVKSEGYLAAIAAVTRYVKPYVSDSAPPQWVSLEAMPQEFWEGKKRKGLKDTTRLVFSAFAVFCQDNKTENKATIQDVENALRDQADDALKSKQRVEDDGEKPSFDVLQFFRDKAKFFADSLKAQGRLNPVWIYDTEGLMLSGPESTDMMQETGCASLMQQILTDYAKECTHKKPDIKMAESLVSAHMGNIKKWALQEGWRTVSESIEYDGWSSFQDFCELFTPFYNTFHSPKVFKKAIDREVDMAAIYHTIWQIKRKLLDIPVKDHMATIFYGHTGVGKDEAMIPTILYPMHGWIRKYEDPAHLTDVEKHGRSAYQYLVTYIDEMATDNADMNVLKAVISGDHMQIRTMHQNKEMSSMKNNTTIIGTSNRMFSSYSNDPTGSRRFCEITLTLTSDELTDEIKEFRGSKGADSRMTEGSWAHKHAYQMWQMVDATQDNIFMRDKRLLQRLRERQDAMTPGDVAARDIEVLGFHAAAIKKEDDHPEAIFQPLQKLARDWRLKAESRLLRMKSIMEVRNLLESILGTPVKQNKEVGYYLVPIHAQLVSEESEFSWVEEE